MKLRMCVVLVTILGLPLGGQTHLSVPVNDQIYTILDIAWIRGAIPYLSVMRPFPNSTVRQHLTGMFRKSNDFSAYEISVLQDISERYRVQSDAIRFRVEQQSAYRVALSEYQDYHTNNATTLNFAGDALGAMSFAGNFAFCFDHVNENAFVPYSFTKQWISDHKGPALSHTTRPEFTIRLLDEIATLRWARVRRNWGIGHSSLLLSYQARPIDGFEVDMWLAPWAHLGYLCGSLGDATAGTADNDEQKMLSAHRFEVFPFEWLYLSAWEAVIWGKRFEPSYLNPLMVYYLTQDIIGDMDNLAIGGSVAVALKPHAMFYFASFIDEIGGSSIAEGLFRLSRHMFALQGGVKAPMPFLPLSLLTIQYTKIEPYCYTHYPQEYPFFTNPININFTHDGENLGYYLPPNSDEFFLRLEAIPSRLVHPYVQYQYIRHGTGDHTKGQIEGDMDKYLIYDVTPAEKDFLHDGIYEFIHILKIGTSLHLSGSLWGEALLASSAKLSLEYAFVYAENFGNVEGVTKVDHYLYLGLEVTALAIPLSSRQWADQGP